MMRVMNHLLRYQLDRICKIYIDDIIIATHTYAEYKKAVRETMRVLEKPGIWFNKDKYEILPKKLHILGFIITEHRLEPDPTKIDSIRRYPRPITRKRLQRFMGIVNFLRIFCHNLTVIAGPLSELQGETKRFKWTELHEESFNQYKEIIQSNRVLKPINHESGEPIYLITDASQSGIAGWIGQYNSTGKIRPAEFHSRKFNPTQFHWPTIQKELLAIYNSIKHFQNILSGHFVVVLIDHKPLLNFMSQRQDSAIRQRWQEFMIIVNFIIEHIEGKENMIPDALSRSSQDGEIKDTRPYLLEDQTKPPPLSITTNYFTLHIPNIYNSYNILHHRNQLIRDYITGPSIHPHRQTVNN